MMPMMWMLMVLTNDGVFFPLALPQANGLHATAGPPQEAPGFHRQRQVHQATPSPWVRRECPRASLEVVQKMGVFPQHRRQVVPIELIPATWNAALEFPRRRSFFSVPEHVLVRLPRFHNSHDISGIILYIVGLFSLRASSL